MAGKVTLGTIGKPDVRRLTADLAALVREQSAAFPAEDRDWLTDPLRHAADGAAAHAAEGRRPADRADAHARAEADVHEVQTWALLAMRHGHWSPRVADDVDRRCEAILDELHRAAHPAAVRRAA